MTHRAFTAVLALALLGAARGAAAQSAVPDRARAELLFQAAKTLMADGRFAEAYPLLAESQRIHAGGGTLLAMAMCHEGAGRPATALANFREALAQAIKARRADRVALAEQHIAAIERAAPRVALRPTADGGDLADLRITLDGRALPRDTWARGEPVDPGPHVLLASASDVTPWTVTVEAPREGTLSVDVPRLVRVPPPAGDPPPRAVAPTWLSPPPPSGTREYATYAALGVGGAAIVTGVAFGIAAVEKKDASRQRCEGTVCTPEGLDLDAEARTSATVANVAIGGGLAVAVTGVVLLLTAPSSSHHATGPTPRISPKLTTTGGGADVSWTF